MDQEKTALTSLTDGALRARIDAIREITGIFWLERMAYIAIIVASLLILLAGALIALIKGQFETTQKIVTGGSGSVCAVAISGLLYMWNKSLNLAIGKARDEQKGKDKEGE